VRAAKPLIFMSVAACFSTEAAGASPAAPSDSGFSAQWNLRNTGQVLADRPGEIGADIDWLDAYELHGGLATTTVAIVADGVDEHLEYAGRLLPGYSNDADPFDWRSEQGVGTHMAGILASGADNGHDLVGVLPTAAVLPVHVVPHGSIGADSTADGIAWATGRGARVIVVAPTLMAGSPRLEGAVNAAVDADVVLIAPAGDDAGYEPRYPAAYAGCLAVTSTDHRDEFDPLANFGAWIDLSAPGADVLTTDGTSGYAAVRTTAAAAAHVAGVAAMLRSYRPDLSADAVIETLRLTADDLGAAGHDAIFGAGRVNARRALEAVGRPTLRIDRPVPWPDPGWPFSHAPIWVTLSGAADVDEVLLHAVVPGSDEVTTPFAPIREGRYSSFLPNVACDTALGYYVTARGSSGFVASDPADAPDRVHAARTATLTSLFEDDFEQDRGWLAEPAGAANAEGAWTRVPPGGTSAQPGYDAGPYDESHCFVTGQHFGGSAGLTDVDGGPFVLTSPLVNLTSDDTEVRFTAWLHTEFGSPDELVIDVSRDGGHTWARARRLDATGGWQQHAIRLSEFVDLAGSRLRVRFTAADIPNDSLTEAAIDDFEVLAIRCHTRRGDANGDGLITTSDLTALPDCLSGPWHYAANNQCLIFDLTIDGHLDLIDIAGLQRAIPDR